MLLIDVGARGGVHPRWRNIVERCLAVDADADVDTGQPPLALADREGEREFYLLHARPCSSLCRPNTEHLARFPGALQRFAIDETRTVRTTTLDDIAPRERDIALKLDVEGAERAVLAGAGRTLPRVVLVETEVWFAPVYCGGALFHELHADLVRAGFSLVTLRRCWWRDHGGVPHLTTGDALYVRAEHRAVPALLEAYRTPRSLVQSALSAAARADGGGLQRLLDGADAAMDDGW